MRAYLATPEGAAKNAANGRKQRAKPGAAEANRAAGERFRRTPFGRAGALISSARTRRPVTVTREWVQERLEAGVCEATGIPFDFMPRADGGCQNPMAPSLDRKDPAGDYTPDNTQVVVWMYNMAKGELRDEVARPLLKRIAACL